MRCDEMNEAKEILNQLPKSRDLYTTIRSAKLEALREIAACFQEGDAVVLSVARGLLKGCGVMEDSPMMDAMNRVQAAAKLAEDEA
jgi:hypothetical protein